MSRILRRFRLRARLLGSFGTLVVLMAGLTGLSIYQIQQQDQATNTVARLAVLNRAVMQLKFRDADVSGWQTAYAWDVASMGGIAATDDKSPNRKGFLDSAGNLNKELAAVPAADLTPSEAALYATIKQNLLGYLDADKQVVQLFRQNTPASIKQANDLIVGDAYNMYLKALDATIKLSDSVAKRGNEAQSRANSLEAESRVVMIVVFLVAVVLALGGAVVITGGVVDPAHKVVDGLRALAGRDLSMSLDAAGADEMAEMAQAFNEASDSMREALTGVAERAAELTTASQQLTTVSERMDAQATTTSDQAGSAASAAGQVSGKVATVASAAEEMTVSIEEIARSTAAAVAVAADAVTSTEATKTAVGSHRSGLTSSGSAVRGQPPIRRRGRTAAR